MTKYVCNAQTQSLELEEAFESFAERLLTWDIHSGIGVSLGR